MMRKFTNGTDLVRQGITRFVTSFLSLDSLNKQRDKPRTMFVSEDWKGSKWSHPSFRPLVKVIRLVDSEKELEIGHIFKAMEVAREEIKQNLKHDEKRYGPILKIVDDKWIWYYLNPAYFYFDLEIDRRDSIMKAFNKCNVRLQPDSDQDKVSMELDLYRYSMMTLGTDIAVRQRVKIYSCNLWWANHCSSAPNLQRMAQRVFNLTCTSSGCKLNNLVFVQYNTRLKKRHLERFQIEDPTLVKDLDPTSE
ncbi:hypothetical protein AMTRI_Chr03g48260 [Amborella trichopoda]